MAVFSTLLQRGALPYLPLVDTEGVDAVASVTGNRLVRIQIKAAGISGGKDPRWFQVQKLEVARDLFVVCVEAPNGVVGDMWIFPSVVFDAYANRSASGVRDLDLCGGEKKYGQPLWELLCGFRNRWELITEYGDYEDLLGKPQDLEDVLTMKDALESPDEETRDLLRYLVNNPSAESGEVLHTEECSRLPFQRDEISDAEYMGRVWPRWRIFYSRPPKSPYIRECSYCMQTPID